ncbi:MAG: hypothetical protein ACKVOW_18670 [Chitinophagaceae bacterium]
MKYSLLFCLIGILNNAVAQKISLPELFSIAELSGDRIDTLLKQKEYRLMQKETDSGVNLFYYTSLERNPNGTTWVRSLSYKEIATKEIISRLVTYRTYRKKEYLELLEWLLRNNFKTIKRDNFGEYIDTNYSDGTKKILVKQSKQKLASGVAIWAYQFEFGK